MWLSLLINKINVLLTLRSAIWDDLGFNPEAAVESIGLNEAICCLCKRSTGLLSGNLSTESAQQ